MFYNVSYNAEKYLVKLLLEESKKVITKIDTEIAIEIEMKYPETTEEERERLSWSTTMLNGFWKWSVIRSGKSLDLKRVIKVNKIKHITQRHHCLN